MPPVSVVMVTRNRREQALQALRHLAGLPEAPELIVVDNGSSDGTGAAIADDDSWWEPGALTAAAGVFDDHPRLGLLAARIVVQPQGEVDPLCTVMAASPLPRADDLPGPSLSASSPAAPWSAVSRSARSAVSTRWCRSAARRHSSPSPWPPPAGRLAYVDDVVLTTARGRTPVAVTAPGCSPPTSWCRRGCGGRC